MSAAKLHGHHVAGLRMMGQLLCSHCWKCFSNETDIVAHMMAEHSRASMSLYGYCSSSSSLRKGAISAQPHP